MGPKNKTFMFVFYSPFFPYFNKPGKMRACSRPCDGGEQSRRQSCPPDQIQLHHFQQKKNKYKKVQIQTSTSTNANKLMPVMSHI